MSKQDLLTLFSLENEEFEVFASQLFASHTNLSWLPHFFVDVSEQLHSPLKRMLSEKIMDESYHPTPSDISHLSINHWMCSRVAEDLLVRVLQLDTPSFMEKMDPNVTSEWVGVLFEAWSTRRVSSQDMMFLLKAIPTAHHSALSEHSALTFALGMEHGNKDMAMVVADCVPHLVDERLSGVIMATHENQGLLLHLPPNSHHMYTMLQEIQMKVIRTLKDFLTDEQCFRLWDEIGGLVHLPEEIASKGQKVELLKHAAPNSSLSSPKRKI